MKRKVFLTIVIIIAAAIIFCGCGGPAAIVKPNPAGALFKVEGSCSAELSEDKTVLEVYGTTNLMDGTNGVISVIDPNGTTIEKVNVQKQGDNLKHTFNVAPSWPKDVYAFVTFDTQQGDQQSSVVKETYGVKFENLEGEDIIWNQKGVIACFQSELVAIK